MRFSQNAPQNSQAVSLVFLTPSEYSEPESHNQATHKLHQATNKLSEVASAILEVGTVPFMHIPQGAIHPTIQL